MLKIENECKGRLLFSFWGPHHILLRSSGKLETINIVGISINLIRIRRQFLLLHTMAAVYTGLVANQGNELEHVL